MFMHGQGFGEEIREIYLTGYETDIKLELTDTIFDPVKAHVHTFGLFGANGVVGSSNGTLVVAKFGGWGLGVAEAF